MFGKYVSRRVESSEPIVHNDMYNSSITLLVHSFPVAAKNKIEIKNWN